MTGASPPSQEVGNHCQSACPSLAITTGTWSDVSSAGGSNDSDIVPSSDPSSRATTVVRPSGCTPSGTRVGAPPSCSASSPPVAAPAGTTTVREPASTVVSETGWTSTELCSSESARPHAPSDPAAAIRTTSARAALVRGRIKDPSPVPGSGRGTGPVWHGTDDFVPAPGNRPISPPGAPAGMGLGPTPPWRHPTPLRRARSARRGTARPLLLEDVLVQLVDGDPDLLLVAPVPEVDGGQQLVELPVLLLQWPDVGVVLRPRTASRRRCRAPRPSSASSAPAGVRRAAHLPRRDRPGRSSGQRHRRGSWPARARRRSP